MNLVVNRKKILYVTGKWPYKSKINDGGDATILEYIEALGEYCLLDLLVVRDDIDSNSKVKNVNSVIVYNEDVTCFDSYGLKEDSKFLKWIMVGEIIARKLVEIHKDYDIIIIQHVMFSLGLKRDQHDILEKIILLPMFMGGSYIKSGEYVPKEYLDKEKIIIPYIGKIITPSAVEKNMLISDYNARANTISIIPRPVKFEFSKKNGLNHKEIKIILIGSVRSQKNHIDAIKMMNILAHEKENVVLYCCGAIQEKSIYNECTKLINEFRINRNVIFLGNKSSSELKEIIDDCDINISVSKWETFGRGIYEGMAAGLPTVVYDNLECINNSGNIGVKPIIVSNYSEMASKILSLIDSKSLYTQESRKGEMLWKKLSKKTIYCKIRKEILSLQEEN